METIIVTLLSGFFSLAAIWYQNYLQNKSTAIGNKAALGDTSLRSDNAKVNAPVLRIIFTILLVASPVIILLLFGKNRLHLEDKTSVVANRIYTTEPGLVVYYAIWTVIILLAIMIGWTRKTLFEKIVLLVAFAIISTATLWQVYNTLNNPGYPIGPATPMEAVPMEAKSRKKHP